MDCRVAFRLVWSNSSLFGTSFWMSAIWRKPQLIALMRLILKAAANTRGQSTKAFLVHGGLGSLQCRWVCLRLCLDLLRKINIAVRSLIQVENYIWHMWNHIACRGPLPSQKGMFPALLVLNASYNGLSGTISEAWQSSAAFKPVSLQQTLVIVCRKVDTPLSKTKKYHSLANTALWSVSRRAN